MPETIFGRSALYRAFLDGECNTSLAAVDIFPSIAASEAAYLAVSDANIYEMEPEAVGIRRELVELGYTCASTLERYARDFDFYLFDCANSASSCDWTTPSLPFRRLATTSMRVHYLEDEAYWWFENDATLDNLPGFGNNAAATNIAVIKLFLLLLAAALVWMRSDRVTSSPHWLYRHCVETANGKVDSKGNYTSASAESLVEDAIFGLIAVVSRLSVSIWRLGHLYADDQARVCYIEITAGCVSLASWIVRYWVIKPNLIQILGGTRDCRGPLARLGGSMAIVDATCAVILAFAEPPIYLDSIARFDNTARLLTGLLLAIVTLHRCLFGVAGNTIILEAHTVGFITSSTTYETIVVFAAAGWIVQAISVAIAIADLVASPMAFALTRNTIGPDGAVAPCLFLALVAASLPRLLGSAVKLVGDTRKQHMRE